MGARQVLVYVLDGVLRLLHPVMPFLTEELWQAIPHKGEALMVAQWPLVRAELAFERECREFSAVIDAIRAIRTRRAELNVPPSKKANIYIQTDTPGVFAQGAAFIQRLAYASRVEIDSNFEVPGAVQVVTQEARIFIPQDELIDMQAELARLEKERKKIVSDIEMFTKKLSNEGFTSKAPENVIAAEREKLARANDLLIKIDESISAVKPQ